MQKVIFLGCGYGEIELILRNYENKIELILFSPLCIECNLSAKQILINYEIGAELGILALLAHKFLAKSEIFKDFINSLDVGYLASECNVGEEEIDEIVSADSITSENITLIIGSDLENHPKRAEIAVILAALNSIIKIDFQKAPKLQEIFSNFTKTDSIKSLKKALNSEILLDESNGFFARICKTNTSYFLNQAQKDQNKSFLIAPNQFLKAQKIPQDMEFVEISFLDKKLDSMLGKIKAKIAQNKMLKGIIAELALPQIPSEAEFFAYSQIQLKAIN